MSVQPLQERLSVSHMLNNDEMLTWLQDWIYCWNRHDLEGVLLGMAENVEFEHWTGRIIRGKRSLRRAWQPWFDIHGDFHFSVTSVCADPKRQSIVFEWRLEWPSPEAAFLGQPELREGVDVIQLRDGKVTSKRSYMKSLVRIDGQSVWLVPQNNP